MNSKDDIDPFFDWVECRRTEIDDFPDHFRRILLLSLLDALAKCAFPQDRRIKTECALHNYDTLSIRIPKEIAVDY